MYFIRNCVNTKYSKNIPTKSFRYSPQKTFLKRASDRLAVSPQRIMFLIGKSLNNTMNIIILNTQLLKKNPKMTAYHPLISSSNF